MAVMAGYPGTPSQILTERLELVVLDTPYLAALVAGTTPPDLGFTDPDGSLAEALDVAELRLGQLDLEPTIAPWLMRAIVLRDRRIAVGFLGYHAAPDAAAMVEVGYEVHPAHRRHGYAREAVIGLLAWGAQHGARTVRACVAPANAASLALVAQLGFVHVGEQVDPVDGLELVFECAA